MADIREYLITNRKDRLEKLAKKIDFKYIDLSDEQEHRLFLSILNMPIENQNLLIFKNYYNHSFTEIEDLICIENAKGEYLNLLGMLSEIINLDDVMISESSMQKVCQRVAEKINQEVKEDFEEYNKERKQVYSRKKINIRNIFGSRIASIIIVFLISSALLVSANVYAQGQIFEWIVNTFEKYTEITIVKESIVDRNNFDIEIGYIPKNFTLADESLLESIDTYYYTNRDKFLVIEFIYDNMNIKLDSEGDKKEQFEIDGNIVTTWRKQNENYFLFNKNKISCQIYGNISKDEFLEIYKNISINKK